MHPNLFSFVVFLVAFAVCGCHRSTFGLTMPSSSSFPDSSNRQQQLKQQQKQQQFDNREFDLVIYGATGFTGQLAVEYVQRHYPDLKVALAGRNRAKLERVRDRIYGQQRTTTSPPLPPLIVADAQQQQKTTNNALAQMVASTKVVANYAGTPFLDKALPVVQACVEAGTCYVDITGEVPLQRASYDLYHKLALATQTLIVHACGFDSIPSDIGAMMAANAMKEQHGCGCTSVTNVFGKSNGGVSGGTIHTAMNLLFGNRSNNRDDESNINESKDGGCYALDPKGGNSGPDTKDTATWVEYDEVSNQYVVPFVMARANAPVVRKSNALSEYTLFGSSNCSYREVLAVASKWEGYKYLLGFGMLAALLAFPPTRWLLLKYVLPKPGEGPSKDLQEHGFFESFAYALGNTPEQPRPKVVAYVKSGNAGDPGYKATAQMSIESALCMALERSECSAGWEGGVLTPATGLGQVLVHRLNQTGMQLGVVGGEEEAGRVGKEELDSSSLFIG